MSEQYPLPEELSLLADQVGASPANFAPFDPSASISLYTDISGRRGYDTLLSNAAIELYEILRWDDGLAEAFGNIVIVHNKKIGKVPNLRKPLTDEYKLALETLIHSSAHIASAPTIAKANGSIRRQSCVAVPLDSGAFAKGEKYEHLSATAFRNVVVALTQIGWIDVVPVHYNHETGERKRTRIRPRQVMLDGLVKMDLVFPYHPEGPKLSNRKPDAPLLFVSHDLGDGEKKQIPLSRALSEDEAVLVDLNEALHAQKLCCPLRDYRQYENMYDFGNGRPRHTLNGSKTLRRVFSEEDGRAGRLYGHWVQRLPKALRGQLLINNHPTVELDYNGMQLALLYADAGKPLPNQADLYAVPGLDREDMKAVLLRTVGTNTRDEAIAALRKMLYDQGRNQEGRAEILYDAFWSFHPEVCPHGKCADDASWAKLQELDSTLALNVLKELLGNGIVAIPIHDSFIVEERNAEVTKTIMLNEFKKLFECDGVSVNEG